MLSNSKQLKQILREEKKKFSSRGNYTYIFFEVKDFSTDSWYTRYRLVRDISEKLINLWIVLYKSILHILWQGDINQILSGV